MEKSIRQGNAEENPKKKGKRRSFSFSKTIRNFLLFLKKQNTFSNLGPKQTNMKNYDLRMISIALANILKRKTYLPTTSFFLPQRNKFHDSGFCFFFGFFLLLLFILFASHSICAHRRLITPVTSYWNFFSIPNFNFYRQK